jgi:hypothetical protein
MDPALRRDDGIGQQGNLRAAADKVVDILEQQSSLPENDPSLRTSDANPKQDHRPNLSSVERPFETIAPRSIRVGLLDIKHGTHPEERSLGRVSKGLASHGTRGRA